MLECTARKCIAGLCTARKCTAGLCTASICTAKIRINKMCISEASFVFIHFCNSEVLTVNLDS